MEKSTKAVENAQTAAAGEQVVKDSGATAEAEKLRGELEAAKAERATEKAAREKAERDRDNYREGLLRAKGKKKPEVDVNDPDSIIKAVEEATEEKLLEAKAKEESERKSLENQSQSARIAELERALQAKQAATSIAGGSSAGTAPAVGSEVKNPNAYWTEEQKNYLRTVKGFSDEQIARAENMARDNSGSLEHGSFVAPRKY